MFVQSNIGERSCNHCCCGKEASLIYSECVFVALDIQNATRMRHIMLTSVACLPLLYFSTLSHKRNEFTKKKVHST